MPGSTKFVRQHFYETVEHKATSRQLSAVPHQAPQRERVSLVVRGSVLLQSTGDPLNTHASWKSRIKGNTLESVPRLLWLLEPKIVFAYAKASCRGHYAESQYCQGMFFEGYHRGGGRAHGVYEGTYWELLANIGELTEALTQMAVGPAVLEEPVLKLPAAPTLPSWEMFKPVLQPLPPLPQLMDVAVKLPPFKPPKVAAVEYEAPQLLPLPDLLDEEDEAVPSLSLTDGLKPKGLDVQPEETVFDAPLAPSYPLQPPPPPYDKPKFGADWTGNKPFQDAEPLSPADAVLPIVVWQHPPPNLPKPPVGDLSRPSASSSASLARMIGGLALAGATADITDHPPSPRPAHAVPPQASGSSLNPQSGFVSVFAAGAQELHSVASGAGDAAAGHEGQDLDPEGGRQAGASSGRWEGSHAQQGDVSGAVKQPGYAPASHDPAALGQNDASAPAAGLASRAAGINNSSAAGAAAGSHMAPWSNNGDKGGYSSRAAAAESAARQDPTGVAASAVGYQGAPADPASIAAYRPEGRGHADDGAWSEMAAGFGDEVGVDGQRQGGARSTGLVSEGSSRKYRNAVESSNRPGGGDHAGRRGNPAGKPVQGPPPEFSEPFQEPLPPREHPAFHPLPVFEHLPFQPARFAPPCAPRPVGFLAGYAPLLLLDTSGTMHPSKGGRFQDMKVCVLELLKPTGELAAVASGFDVIAFSSAPVSWAACYEGHLALLVGASKPLLGRQNGRRAYRPNSASTGCMRLQRTQAGKLVPAEPALLAEAARWVDSWQEPTGHTNYDAALQMAERYMEADCAYVFSDGLSDYAVVLLEKVKGRIAQGERVPVIHTVGFFAEEQRGGPGERFLRQLSALTGGTFQEYMPEALRVWNDGAWLEYDLKEETEAVRAERLWSEAALQAQRRSNARLGLEESFADLIARLPQLHTQRVGAEAAAYEEEVATLRAAHEAECSMVRKLNEDIQRRSDDEYQRLTEPARSRNERHQAAAQHQHALAMQQWQRDYDLAVMEWNAGQEPADDDDDIKVRPRGQRKFPGVASMQPEDSAEQLSGMPMPSRPRSVAQSASFGQQLTAKADSITASESASMQLARPVSQTLSGASGVGSIADSHAAVGLQQKGTFVQQQHKGVSDSTGGQQGPTSRHLAGAVVTVYDQNQSPAGAQQCDDQGTSTGAFRRQPSRRASSMEGQITELSEASGLEAQAANVADVYVQQEQQECSTMQMAQQQGWASQQAEAGALEHQASVEPQASTSQSSRSKQAQPGESVYAPRDLTVLEQYEADVVHAYATSFLAEAVLQGMLPAAANSAAAEQHTKLLAEVRQRNALNKVRHLEEVQAERAAWEAHEQNVKSWKASKAGLEAGYAKELAEAKSSHQQRVARLRRQWEKEQKVLQAEYNRRVGIERAQHDQVCQPIRQRNAERREAAGSRREQRKLTEKANDELVLAAEQLHHQRLYEAQAALSGQLVVARQQHADVCLQLQKEHAALQQAALQEHALQKAVIGKWNDQATLEARGRYSAEVARLQKAHVRHCEAIHAQHDAVCLQIRQHNEAIWPQVTIAQAAQEELDRVGRFIEHIRACAERMEVGVNYVPETPNLDRVVEMSALTEALNKAFPDMTPDQYPWPASHRGASDRVRGSWPTPPNTHTSASTAQQALDRIRQAALPSARSQSVSKACSNFSKQQQVLQSANGMWQANSCTAAVTYTSTTHSGVSYRPSTASIRPSTASNRPSTASNRPSTASNRPTTAHASSLTPGPSTQQARPASARESSGHRSVATLAGGLRDKTSMLGTSVVLPPDSTHLQITKLLHSKGYRSVSPLSEGSTGATPSPAQSPCSVLSCPNTAGHRRGHQPARKAFDAAEISNCLQRHKLAAQHCLC